MATRYDAFISYSHAADGKLAPALQNALQRFAKPWYKLRALHLFRDQTSLSATPGLWPAIEQALQGSRYFLLLASPEAAQSRWVQQEVAWWLEHQSPQTMLIGLTDGKIAREEAAADFNWDESDGTTALPPNLKGVFTEDPLWVDFRWAKGQEHLSSKDPEFQNALAALAAPLRGIPKENLIGEDVRQHRRAMLLARGGAVLMFALLLAAVVAALFWYRAQAEAVVQRDKATEAAAVAQIRALSAQSRLQRNLDQDERGALLAVEAYATSMRNGGVQEGVAAAALRDTVDVPFFSRLLDGDQGGNYSLAFSKNGKMLAAGNFDGTVQLWNMESSPPSLMGKPFPAADGGEIVEDLEFSPDGNFLVTGGFFGDMKWWDLRDLGFPGPDEPPKVSSREIPRDFTAATDNQDKSRQLRAIMFSPQGDYLAAAGDNGYLQIWRVGESSNPSLTELPSLCRSVLGVPASHTQCLQTGNVNALAFNHDGSLLAAGGAEGIVWVWQVQESPWPLHELRQDGNAVWAISFHPTRDLLAVGGDTIDQGRTASATIALWDPSNESRPCAVLRGHDERVRSLSFSPDGATVASGSEDESVRIWDSAATLMGETCKTRNYAVDVNPRAVLGGSEEFVRAVAFSPSSPTLASTSAGGRVRFWDLGELGTERRILIGHTTYVSSLAFDPGAEEGERGVANPWLASGSLDGTIRLWRPGEEPELIEPPDDGAVKAVALAPPAGRWLAAAGDAGTVYLWDLQDISDKGVRGEPVRLQAGTDPPGIIFALAFSPDGSRLAAAARNGTILVWNLADDDPSRKSSLRVFGRPVPKADFDKTIRCMPKFGPLQHPQMWSVAFSPDGRTIAAGDSDGIVHLFDLEAQDAESMLDLEGHSGGIPSIAFSPDGALLASASCDSTLRLWAAQDAGSNGAHPYALARVLIGHDDAVISVGFSVDGSLLASGSRDQTIRIWDMDRPEDEPGILGGREEWVRAVAFSPDGKTLAAASADAAVRLWSVRPEDLFQRACATVGRDLTDSEWIEFLGPDQPYQPACGQSKLP